jgi:hypothetical protein
MDRLYYEMICNVPWVIKILKNLGLIYAISESSFSLSQYLDTPLLKTHAPTS